MPVVCSGKPPGRPRVLFVKNLAREAGTAPAGLGRVRDGCIDLEGRRTGSVHFVRFSGICETTGAGFPAVRRCFGSDERGGVACSMMNLAALIWGDLRSAPMRNVGWTADAAGLEARATDGLRKFGRIWGRWGHTPCSREAGKTTLIHTIPPSRAQPCRERGLRGEVRSEALPDLQTSPNRLRVPSTSPARVGRFTLPSGF